MFRMTGGEKMGGGRRITAGILCILLSSISAALPAGAQNSDLALPKIRIAAEGGTAELIRPEIRKLAEDSTASLTLRLAAIGGLGLLRRPESVPVLERLARLRGPEGKAARTALRKIRTF